MIDELPPPAPSTSNRNVAPPSNSGFDELFVNDRALEEAPTPDELNISLMPHQKKALSWMVKREQPKTATAHYADRSCRGGILADDQGLGKTITTISLLYSNPPEDGGRWKTLIVCPLSLVDQWKRELQTRVRPGNMKKILVYHGTNREKQAQKLKKFDIVLTTYGTLRSVR